MEYNFDKVIERRGTDSKKWNNLKEDYPSEDLLAMWVADMDFETAKEIKDAFRERVDHGIFGYPYIDDNVYKSIINWAKKRYDWEIKKEWIVFTPGVVAALNIGIKNGGKEGDNVLVQSPVYPPFYRIVENNKRKAKINPIKFNGEKFVMDFEDLESKIDSKTKTLMLCNPHNPLGRSWTREELIRLGEICIENDITIMSDEIHGDLTLKGIKHTPIASISTELANRTITFMSPSKSFNIAGLFTSLAIIPNKKLRDRFQQTIEEMEIGHVHLFGALGLERAYSQGEEWLKQVLLYIEDNIDFSIDYIEKNIPEIKVIKPEATYLLWLNFSGLKKDPEEINQALLDIGKIILNDGRPYGIGGEGYFRLNVGCPRTIVEEGLDRIKKTVASLKEK